MTGSAPTPQAMTLEEALARLGVRGRSLRRDVFDDAPDEWYAVDRYGSTGRRCEGWSEVASAVLGYPVVERDDTAELVEALERCQHRLAVRVEQVEMQHMGMPKDAPTRVQFEEDVVALDQSRAALAKWKAGNP